jgi:arsenite methyltransferase
LHSQSHQSHLREKVRAAYSAAAVEPERPHAFPVGRQFAESLGYPQELLATLPNECVEAFAGVSNVSIFADVPAGAVVLDLGCGAGMDSLIAARRAGPAATVVGVDFSFPMLARARRSARAAGIDNVMFCHADGERLPLADHSIGVTLVNGIFNLNPARKAIFRELGRVVSQTGMVYASELILRGPLPVAEQQCETNWFA